MPHHRKIPWRRIAAGLALAVALTCLAGCSHLRYYGQAIWGQTRLLLARQPIERLLEDPDTPEPLRERLAFLRRVRTFAVGELALPDQGFQTYVELPPGDDGQPPRAVVWNVVAAPELSTEPRLWCFPIAGCVAYRGYFSERRARRFAARLAEDGYDVDVGGAAAYSTLGWFEDPILSTVIAYPDLRLAGLVFHELAHQVVYVAGDTTFNESFATAVEVAGLRRWLAAENRTGELDAYLLEMEREAEVTHLVLGFRERLAEIYTGSEDDDVKRKEKARLFDELRRAYGALKAGWGLDTFSWDGFFDRPLNNAHLVWIGAYHEQVPALLALLDAHGGDLPAFYDAVRALSERPAGERSPRLLEEPRKNEAEDQGEDGHGGEDRQAGNQDT